MTREEALDFLRRHQPLPDTADVWLLDQLRAAILTFHNNPDPACIPLLLHAFGLFDDIHIYQALNDAMKQHKHEDVVPHLVHALGSQHQFVRFTAAGVAACFPDEDLIESLEPLLSDGQPVIRLAAVAALEKIGGPEVRRLFKTRLIFENDPDVTEALESFIELYND